MNHSPDPTRASARVSGVAAILAPVLLLASTIAFLVDGQGINHGVLGGTVGVWSAFAFVIGFVGIARSLETSAPRLAATLLVLSIIGFMTGLSYSISAIDLDVTGKAFMAADATGNDAIGFLAFDPWGLGLPLALVLTAVLIWRTRVHPRWVAVPLLLGGLLFVPSREIGLAPLAMAADACLIIGLAPLGWALLTRRAERDAAAVPATPHGAALPARL
ncbi:MAG: hypothetical protein ACRDT6_20530 [Micromonosporaceae bacterium]